MSKYVIGASSDIGVEREIQEDYVSFNELDDENVIAVVADGSASRSSIPQPAAIVTVEIIDYITDLFKTHPDFLFDDPRYFLKAAFLHANRVLGAFKMGNDEIYGNFSASVTACLFLDNGFIYFAHSGNTRFCVIRNNMMIQATDDHTVANDLLNRKEITEEEYYTHYARLQLTSGLGMLSDNAIEIQTGRIKGSEGDVYLMTTDGVHYAIRPEYIQDIVLDSDSATSASESLISAARDIIKYPDNMSALVAYAPIQESEQ